MTAFFIPGLEADVVAAERAYEDLRSDSEARLGTVAHKRRISGIACRRQGADCTIGVGDSGAIEGRTVIAIFQLGRDAYVIHCRDPDEPSSLSTVDISRRTVYAVTDFD
ncbi:MAG TPA: hypothetical protein VHW26_13360 [Solirubrobacteraceae bacterium]|nr:hypothetical protein [Solirubrobacteraceae bacterium]